MEEPQNRSKTMIDFGQSVLCLAGIAGCCWWGPNVLAWAVRDAKPMPASHFSGLCASAVAVAQKWLV